VQVRPIEYNKHTVGMGKLFGASNSMQIKLIRIFLLSAAGVLLITAAAKIVSSFGGAQLLQKPDPLFGISFRNLFWVVSSTELAVALICFYDKRILLQAGLVAWLATSFVAYRLGLLWIGYHKPCSCLGNLTDALHIPPQTADTAMKIILAYLLIGSYGTLFWLWRQRKKAITCAAGEASLNMPTTGA
jgi:hypothetical protein